MRYCDEPASIKIMIISNTLELVNGYHVKLNCNLSHTFSLFNTQEFINLHAKDPEKLYIFSLHSDKSVDCLGICHFYKSQSNNFVSPINGSFGNFEFAEKISVEVMEEFMDFVINYLLKSPCDQIKIKFSPDIYNASHNSIILSFLLRHGFKIESVELNQYIKSFDYILDESVCKGNRKRIRKAIDQNLEFKQVNPSEYESVYQVIYQNRARRGFPITMTWQDLKKMTETFPDKSIFFAVFKQNIIIASAICFEVSNQMLYVFYWGELGGFETLSPIAFLSKSIVEYAKAHNFKVVDIGTSSVNGMPNYGLHKFKVNIGCDTCSKFLLYRVIPPA